MAPRALAAAGLTIVLICEGCGNGRLSGNRRLSGSEFRVKANRICAEMHRKVGSNKSLAPQTLTAGVQTLQSGIAQLERLKPPASDARKYDDFLSHLKQALVLVSREGPQLITLLHGLDRASPKRLGETPGPRYVRILRRVQQLTGPVNVIIARADTKARALGLPKCASALG